MITLKKYLGKKVAVLGLARSGNATIKAMQAGGAFVQSWDDSEIAQSNADASILKHYDEWDWNEIAALVVSPAILLNLPKPHPAVELARKHNVRITSDISLLMEECLDASFIGITGTNGKSTTTALIAHCLAELGARVECGGNIGVAALELAPLGAGEYYVLELSSYQLEGLDYGVLNVACFLNITPDHLERHGNMANYVAAKERIFKGQGTHDKAIIAVDDDYSLGGAARLPHAITVSSKSNGAHYYMEDGCMIDGELALDLSMMQSLQGVHNHQNALVAYAALRSLGYEPTSIANSMQSFQGLPHRMERIREWDGMLWVNDSKATNADAAWQSISTYQNIYWIVGGALKQGGIDALAPLAGRITHAYVIGADTAPVAASLAEMGIAYTISGDMSQAVKDAFSDASGQQNAVILLAPAAASFDQYRNFEERGDHFRELVLGLT